MKYDKTTNKFANQASLEGYSEWKTDASTIETLSHYDKDIKYSNE